MDEEKRFGNPQDRPVRVVLIAKKEGRKALAGQTSEGGFNCKEGGMRRPSGSSRDESIAAKWSDLRQYEEDQEAALREANQVLFKSENAHFIITLS